MTVYERILADCKNMQNMSIGQMAQYLAEQDYVTCNICEYDDHGDCMMHYQKSYVDCAEGIYEGLQRDIK